MIIKIYVTYIYLYIYKETNIKGQGKQVNRNRVNRSKIGCSPQRYLSNEWQLDYRREQCNNDGWQCIGHKRENKERENKTTCHRGRLGGG